METKKVPTKEQYTELLLQEWLSQQKGCSNEEEKFLSTLANLYKKDNRGLFQLYLAIQNGDKTYFDEENGLIYRLNEKGCNLQFCDMEMNSTPERLKPMISTLVDITEHILPAGTVVTLEKAMFEKVIDSNKVQDIKVVIVYRFLSHTEDSYFTYGGVIYPVSTFNRTEILKFTPALIERVLQEGYSDMEEDAFVYYMKSKLILEQGQVSAGMKGEY